MGTLHAQKPRNHHQSMSDEEWIDHIQKLSRRFDLTVSEVTAALNARENIRANDLYVSNGDSWDEQISGIGQALDGIRDGLRTFAKTFSRKEPLARPPPRR